jgi:hypothetical protein
LSKTGRPLAECDLGPRVPVRRVCRQVLQGHAGPVTAVALSANGEIAVSGGEDRTLRVWDVSTGRCRHVLQGHLRPVGAVAVSADGATAVSADQPHDEEHGWLRVWDLTAGRCLRDIETTVQHTDVGITPDGVWAVSEDWHSESKTGNLWDLRSGEWEFTHKLTVAAAASSLAITVDGATVIEIAQGQIAVPYDVATGEPGPGLHTLTGWITVGDLAVALDGRTAVSGGTVWDPISGRKLRTLDCGFRRVAGVSLTDDGCVAAVGAGNGLFVWHLPSGEPLRRLRGHQGTIHRVAMTGDGALAVTAGADSTVRVWDLLGGQDFTSDAAAEHDLEYACPVCMARGTLRPDGHHSDADGNEEGQRTLCCDNVLDTRYYQECGFTCPADQMRPPQLSFAAVAPSCCGGTTIWFVMLHHLIKTGVLRQRITLREWPSRTSEELERCLEDLLIDGHGPSATQPAEMPQPMAVHVDDGGGNRQATANIFDFAGETLQRHFDWINPRRMFSTDGICLFLDLFFEHRRHETIVREAIRNLWALRRLGPNGRSPLFLAVCVSKLDLLVNVDVPASAPNGWREGFYEKLRTADAAHAPWTMERIKARSELTAELLSHVWPEWQVVRQFRDRFGDCCEFFPMSVFGFSELGRTDLGDRAIEPYGVLEPVLWLLHRFGFNTLE